MATRGSPGVAIKIEDYSGYSFIDNPSVIGGVVGFSSRGEFNKIIKITNTSVQDTVLGLGYNQPKYNMGMYATRAVLNNGGHVHFVRPYGEQVDKTDSYQSDLKSDAFVVAFDRGASRSDYVDKSGLGNTSLDIRHFAATRYVSDGFSGFGGKRKINTIQEAISTGSNVDFQLTAGEEFNEDGKDSDVRSDTNAVLFALVNADPTASIRAADKYTATVKKNSVGVSANIVTLICDSVPSFEVGDIIYFPTSDFTEGNDSAGKGKTATVTKILDLTVTAEFSALDNGLADKSSVTFYCNNDDTTTGVDYLSVKTAVANRAVKKYGEASIKDVNDIKMGAAIDFLNTAHSTLATRIYGLSTTETVTPAEVSGSTAEFTFTPANSVLEQGDELTFTMDTIHSVTGTVTGSSSPYTVSTDPSIDPALTVSCTYGTLTRNIDGTYSLTTTETPASSITLTYTVEGTFTGTVSSITTSDVATISITDSTTYAAIMAAGVTITGYEITSLGDDSYDSSAKIATVAINTNRPKIVNALTFSNPSLDVTSKILTVTCDGDIASKLDKNDAVLVTIGASTGEYTGITVATPTAAGTRTVTGTQTSILNSGTSKYDVTVTFTSAITEPGAVVTIGGATLTKETSLEYTYVSDTAVTGSVTATVSFETYTTLTFTDAISGVPSAIKIRARVQDADTISVGDVIETAAKDKYYVSVVTGSGAITLTTLAGASIVTETSLGSTVIDLTATVDNMLAAFESEGLAINSYVGENATALTDPAEITKYNTTSTFAVNVPAGTSTNYSVGDVVFFMKKKDNSTDDGTFSMDDMFEVKSINSFKDIVVLSTSGDVSVKFGSTTSWKLVDLTASNATIWASGTDGLTISILDAYNLTVPANEQLDEFISNDDVMSFTYTAYNDGIIQRTDKIMVSDDIGMSFNNMGLATVKYEDVDFSGTSSQVYVLSAEGDAIARMYVFVTYHLNGTDYEFEGTISPYVMNKTTNLYIGYAADSALTDTGVRLLINDSGILDNFLVNNAYDLSQTVKDGHLDSVTTMLAYDERDPAIIYDGVWSYLPANNNDTATLSNAWNLFLDKDGTDVSMLIAAGTDISNLFMKNRETLNGTVISAMLNICELRKDCFALFDGVGESNIETTLKKMIGAQGFGIKGRWGAMYDGRNIFYDGYYTLMNVEIVKSIVLASIITANAANGIWWLPPAGETNGVIPTEWAVTEKYPRTFKYPEDTTSDIARLTSIRVNPTRYNSQGMFVWGDFTMQKESSAFDQIHVAMLIAGIHKMAYHYLDKKVFQLNTATLRTNIQSDLQAQLDMITKSNPAGLYSGAVICDDTNNTADMIDKNELHVDLRIKPTKTSRWITLTTKVESTGTSNTQTTSLYV